jgi:hypothetical protein
MLAEWPEKEAGVLKGLLKFSLIGCGSFVVLMILLVAGLLAWDYVDQKIAERQEKAEAERQGSETPATATPV